MSAFSQFSSSSLTPHPYDPCPLSISLSPALTKQYPDFHSGFQESFPITTIHLGHFSPSFGKDPLYHFTPALFTKFIIVHISVGAPNDHQWRDELLLLGEGGDLGRSGLRQGWVGNETKGS